MESSEFLLNMNPRDIPTEDSRDYDDFWDNERKKAEYGLTVNGVFIDPWLYWHTQLWNIFNDILDPINNSIKRIKMKAIFRDNEWIIAEALQQAQQERKGAMIFGSRRLGKSEFISSFIGQGATLFEGSENVVMGGNWGDIDIVMEKVSYGLDALPDYFKFARIAQNLRKEIKLGFKDKKNNALSWSKITCRNHEEGNDTESPAGLTPTRFIMDEVGKSKFSGVFEAAKPSFTSEFGWRCIPILTGTSGDIKRGGDAEKIFNNPNAYNFIVRELAEEGGKKVSVFISGLYRMEGKVETTLGTFIENEKGILLPKDSELFKITAKVKDNAKAEKVIDEEREQSKQSPEPNALLKATMYYPKNTKELFLSDDGNSFPIEAINDQIAYLQANPELQGTPIEVYKDIDGKPKITYNTNKKPIFDYPLKADADLSIKDACILMFEPPMENSPNYLYIAGCDPYNSSQTVNSTSLGSFFIFKRMYDPVSGTFQDRIVLEYTARPPKISQFYENIEMLLELYNAVVMPENAPGNTFINHFDNKNKGYLITNSYDLLKEISPSTSIKNQPKGLPPTKPVQAHYKQLIYQYLTEEIIIGMKDGNIPIKKLGVVRIPSIGLLKELAAFNDTGNFDRYVAFGHVMEHRQWSDKIYPYITPPTQEKVEQPKQKSPEVYSPFGSMSSLRSGIRSPFIYK